ATRIGQRSHFEPSIPTERDAPHWDNPDPDESEGARGPLQLMRDEEAGFPRLAARPQEAQLLHECGPAQAASAQLGRCPGVVPVCRVGGQVEDAPGKVRIRTRVAV